MCAWGVSLLRFLTRYAVLLVFLQAFYNDETRSKIGDM